MLPLKDEVFTRELWEMATECPVSACCNGYTRGLGNCGRIHAENQDEWFYRESSSDFQRRKKKAEDGRRNQRLMSDMASGDLAVMSIEVYENLVGKFELYGLIQEGLTDIAEGKTRPFSKRMLFRESIPKAYRMHWKCMMRGTWREKMDE